MHHLILLSLIFLASCGGSGGDGRTGADRFAAFDDLFAQASGLDVTPTAQLPVSGAFDYRGAVTLNLPLGGAEPVPYVADLSITVDFTPEAVPVNGSITGFQARTGDTLGGTLTISDGVIMREADPGLDYQMTASLAGALRAGASSYQVDGEMTGDFKGRNGDAIAGVVYGDVTDVGDVDIFDGRFVGQVP